MQFEWVVVVSNDLLKKSACLIPLIRNEQQGVESGEEKKIKSATA